MEFLYLTGTLFPSLSSDSIIRGGIKTNVKIFWWLRDRETLFRVFCKCFIFSFFFSRHRYAYIDMYLTIVSAVKYLKTILPVSDRRLASTGWKERNWNAMECFPRSPSTWLENICRSGTINTVNANDLYESFCSCFRPAFPRTFFPRKDCVICDNIFPINKRYIRIYFSSSFEIDIFSVS